METRQLVLGTLDHVLAALEPGRLVRDALETRAEARVRVLAIGKAAAAMARGANAALGDRLIAGLVVSDHHEPLPSSLTGVTGSHPVPDRRSVEAGVAIREFLQRGAEELLVVLVSGGASAIAELPKPGITVEQIATWVERLASEGTPIEEINTVRRHLSLLKNGGVAAFATEQSVLTLVLSDVVGGRPEAVGSGPTIQDGSDPEDAIGIIAARLGEVPGPIQDALRTPVAGGSRTDDVILLAGMTDVAARAIAFLESQGEAAALWTDRLDGEAATRAVDMAGLSRRHTWLVAAGETTVTGAIGGTGGRNQEAALSASLSIQDSPRLFAAIATDGRDGPTHAAGGIVDGLSTQRMRSAGFVPERNLETHDSLPALDSSGDLIMTGPTGNNLGDLWLCFGGA